MWGISLELGEAKATCVLDQVATWFQSLFIISVCMLLFNEKHSHVHVFFLTFVNLLGTSILLEVVQLVAHSYFCTIYQDNNNKHSELRLNMIY